MQTSLYFGLLTLYKSTLFSMKKELTNSFDKVYLTIEFDEEQQVDLQ